MTEFSKYFSQVVKRRGLKCVQAAEICDIDTSVMFRWLNGRVLPKSWERLEQAAEKLRLSPHEMDELKKVYRKETLGEEQSRSFDEILEIIQSLGEAKKNNNNRAVQTLFAYEIHLRDIADRGEFLKLQNKTEVWLSIQHVLAAMSVQRNEKLYIKLSELPEILLMQLKQLCTRISDGRLEILLSGSSTEDVKQYKLRRMREMVALLLSGSQHNISCYSLWNAQESLKQNWMVLDDIFLQFSEDMSQGMMARDAEWAAFFRESFEEMKDRCWSMERKEICWQIAKHKKERKVNNSLEGGKDSFVEYLKERESSFTKSLKEENSDNSKRIAFLQYIPYKSIAMAQRIISMNHSGDLEQETWADHLAGDGLYENDNDVQYISCFTKEGLAKYLQKGEGADFPENFICSLNRRQRYEAVRQIISLAEQKKAIHYIMFRKNTLDMRGICVKWDSEANITLCLGICPEGSKWEEIIISDADIRQEFGRFFACLPQSGLAYGEEDTLKIMKEMVEGAVT